MRIRKIKVLVMTAVIVVSIGSVFAYWTARWTGWTHTVYASKDKPVASPKNRTAALTDSQPESIPVVVKNEAMSQAFRRGTLPPPLPPPSGGPDQTAAELAKRIIVGDEQSMSALLTAIQVSGFSVRGEDGSIIVDSVKPGQGISFDAWEAAAMAKLFGDGMQVKLIDFGNAFSNTLPPFKNAPVANLFLDGVRAAARGNNPTMHFWARFITELGRQSAQPYDLLAEDLDPASVNLDGIQIAFILRRLFADLMVQNRSANQQTQLHPPWNGRSGLRAASFRRAACNGRDGSRPIITDAVWHPKHGPRLIRVQETVNSNLPCTLAELAAQIMDSSAYVSGFGFDKLMEYLKEHGMEGAGKYGAATGVINALLAVIKLIAYYACLETNITMSGQPPLVRTQSPYQPGEQRTLTATVRENIGNWQALNCVRMALNGAGIDFDLPNDGPIKGAEIQWVLIGSGASVNRDGASAYLAAQILEFVHPEGTSTIQNSVSAPTQNFTAPKTDENGQATIDIEGTKQKPPLQGTPVPVMKQSEVRFTVAPKPISMSQDLIDAVGTGYLGGPAGKAIGFPVELLLRSNIHFSKPLVIPVKDWQECDGGWGGTISYTSTTAGSVTTAGGDVVNDETSELTEHGDILLHGNANDAAGWGGLSHGTLTATRNTKGVAHSNVAGCHSTVTEGSTASASGEVAFSVSSTGDNSYQIGLAGNAPSLEGQSRRHVSTDGGCPPHGPDPPDVTSPVTGPVSVPVFTAVADPRRPNVLHGSNTLSGPHWQTQISWNLTQCTQ